MPLVLVAGTTIQCMHGGQGRLLGPGSPNLTVSGQGVLAQGSDAPFSFAPGAPGVLVPCSATTPAGPAPCTTTPTLPAGLTTKLTVGGRPVLLATATGTTASAAGPGTWKVADPGQQVLEAV